MFKSEVNYSHSCPAIDLTKLKNLGFKQQQEVMLCTLATSIIDIYSGDGRPVLSYEMLSDLQERSKGLVKHSERYFAKSKELGVGFLAKQLMGKFAALTPQEISSSVHNILFPKDSLEASFRILAKKFNSETELQVLQRNLKLWVNRYLPSNYGSDLTLLEDLKPPAGPSEAKSAS